MRRFVIAAFATSVSLSPAVAQHGDASRGQQDFRACVRRATRSNLTET